MFLFKRLFNKSAFDREAESGSLLDIEYEIQPELPVLTKAPTTLRSLFPSFISSSRCWKPDFLNSHF